MNTLPASWSARVEAYLAYRHSLGFALEAEGWCLPQFARFAAKRHAKRITVRLAVDWACATESPARITRACRILRLRGFARYCQKFDPQGEVPPTGLFGSTQRRPVPHIYSDPEMADLLQATARLSPRQGLRPLTFRVLFGLLAACGLRVGEAIRLTRSDVDLREGVLSIRKSKHHSSRFVPLHPSTVGALSAYATQRDSKISQPKSDRFFLTDRGQPLRVPCVRWTLQRLTKRLGWKVRGDYPRHRVRDFRHSFIVRSLLRAFKENQEVDRVVLALSTYAGHRCVAHTYWYVTAIPELMAVVSQRFHRCAEVMP
jgi:integrase/recombinase XerD